MKAKHNTDNKGHLYCHIFCNLLLHPRQICNSLYRDRASASYKTLYTLTCYLLASSFVPRHSYNSSGFIPGRQKMRHASFIPAGTRTLPRFGFTAPASIRSATQTPFIAGPLGQIPTQSLVDNNAQHNKKIVP
jgi:hypothetical protein